jgi:hypothetical protein
MGVVGSIISTGLGIAGSLSKASNAGAQQRAMAEASKAEAAISRQNALASFQAGNAQEEMKRRQNRYDMGNLSASIIENGLDLSSGTGADIVYGSAKNQELDALNIRHMAFLQMNNFNQQAALKDYEAATNIAAAKQAELSGWMEAAGSIAKGASQIASSLFTPNTGSSGMIMRLKQ